jgi:A/G-specific adenine glycosylase
MRPFLLDVRVKTKMNPETFKNKLLDWWQENKRELPWKKHTDPYKIWISEVILQQTTVQQGTPYYERFISLFPDVYSLATASEDSVIKAWEGLGYYSRARNLHFTAAYIVSEHKGVFPSSYQDILNLKGIGPYTAAAIASFAFGLQHAVIDGNVIRVVTRICGTSYPVDTPDVLKNIRNFVDMAIINTKAADFNQAIMDFGATRCVPKNPDCTICPLKTYCKAFYNQEVKLIPVKSKKLIRKSRYFHFLVCLLSDDKLIIHQRVAQDIWHSLHQFPLIETDSDVTLSKNLIQQKLDTLFADKNAGINYNLTDISVHKQVLTHQNITGIFYRLAIDSRGFKIKKGHYLVERKKVSNFAFPKIISDYISSHSLF